MFTFKRVIIYILTVPHNKARLIKILLGNSVCGFNIWWFLFCRFIQTDSLRLSAVGSWQVLSFIRLWGTLLISKTQPGVVTAVTEAINRGRRMKQGLHTRRCSAETQLLRRSSFIWKSIDKNALVVKWIVAFVYTCDWRISITFRFRIIRLSTWGYATTDAENGFCVGHLQGKCLFLSSWFPG